MEEAEKIIKDAEGWEGLILGSGCDVARDTPPSNLKALVKASMKYSKRSSRRHGGIRYGSQY